MIYFWLTALTFVGALLFYAAGLFTRVGRLQPAMQSMPVMPSLGGGVAVMTGGSDVIDLSTEIDASALVDRVEFAENDALSTRLELQQQVTLVGELQSQVDEMTEQLLRVQRHSATEVAAPSSSSPSPSPSSSSTSSASSAPGGVTTLPSDLVAALERERLRTLAVERELAELRARQAQVKDQETDTEEVTNLRRELVLAKEQARIRQAAADRLTGESARQKSLLADQARLRKELVRLRAENNAQGRTGGPPRPPPLPAGVMARSPVRLGDTGARSWRQTLQGLVEGLAEREEVLAAVVADELGLVVAASGENSDEIAAAGAVVARAAAQVAHLLPIRRPCKVVLYDERDVTVTLRPIDADGGKLSLVILAFGETRDDNQPGSPRAGESVAVQRES